MKMTLFSTSELYKTALSLWLILVPTLSFGQGFQPSLLNGELVSHKHYSLSYVEDHEQPEWVYYKLTYRMTQGSAKRKDNFRNDPLVLTESASLIDYKGSGYDRGHLAPAADMKFSEEAMSDSFFLSNMSPQTPSFNRGGWKNLETMVRNWTGIDSTLFVVTGPVFNNYKGEIGTNKVTIPGNYYKIIYAESSHKMIAFLMPNEKLESDVGTYTVSVDSIEQLTGLDFFHQLEDDLENELEACTDWDNWDFNPPSLTKSSHPIDMKGAHSQCTRISKSTGNRCKRVVSNGVLCWQHK